MQHQSENDAEAAGASSALNVELERQALSAGIDLELCKRIKLEHLEKFAILIAAEEREACARLCESRSEDVATSHAEYLMFREGQACADEIRKRYSGDFN